MKNNSIEQVNSIFEQPWWLEAVAPGEWGAAEIVQNDHIIARLPYVKTKRFGCKLLGMPDYTQTLGYWIEDTGAKNCRKYNRQKELIEELIQLLPHGYNIDIELDHNCDFLFPFYWAGCRLELAYSYRIENIQDLEKIWKGLADNIRREIKKAEKIVRVENNYPIDTLIEMQEKTFRRQGRRQPSDDECLKRLDETLVNHQARRLLCAVDEKQHIHAASYFVYDSNCCYYLIGGSDPELRNSGAASLLMWEGIKNAVNTSASFDFEGSMIEPIERFFRAFGGVPTPYWRIKKLNFPLSIANYAKPKVKKLIGWR